MSIFHHYKIYGGQIFWTKSYWQSFIKTLIHINWFTEFSHNHCILENATTSENGQLNLQCIFSTWGNSKVRFFLKTSWCFSLRNGIFRSKIAEAFQTISIQSSPDMGNLCSVSPWVMDRYVYIGLFCGRLLIVHLMID